MDTKRRNTLLLALSLLILLLAGLLLQRLLTSKPGLRAVVEADGEVVAVLPLDTDTTLTVECASGGWNRVRVEDGAVFVEAADCPDLTCVHMGPLSAEGGSIACLPHRLIIYVESGEA